MQGNPAYRFVVRRGPQPNQVYELEKEVSNLGRDITNDIVINDREVSRHHLRIMKGADGYTIEDLGSTNGTFVNGKRVTGATPLKNGDMVGLGETVTIQFEVARPGAPSGDADNEPQQTMPSPSESDEDRFKPKPRPQESAPQQQQENPYQPSGQPVYQESALQPNEQEPQFLQQQQQPAAEPVPPQQDYQANDYAAYGPPPPGYDYDPYDVRETDNGGAMQWLIIAFLGVLVLCCCLTVFLAVAVDTFCLYDSIPGLTGLLNGFGLTPNC